MSDKIANLLKAAFFLLVVIVCIMTIILKRSQGAWYPYVGIGLGTVLVINYVKRAFEE